VHRHATLVLVIKSHTTPLLLFVCAFKDGEIFFFKGRGADDEDEGKEEKERRQKQRESEEAKTDERDVEETRL
jgi:hypothetical protein